jgi:ribosome-binding ATPase YchF (GTP1/OBG family)
LADLQTLQKVLPRLEKEARANPKMAPQVEVLKKAQAILDAGKPLYSNEGVRLQVIGYRELQLLTAKPIIYLFNVDETTLVDEQKQKKLAQLVAPNRVSICKCQARRRATQP